VGDPKDGKPRSLGVVPSDRDGEVRMADMGAMLKDGVAFAINARAAGRVAHRPAPGKVLCSGAIARGRRA